MIKEEKVFVPINIRNSGYFKKLGYVINGGKLEVNVIDLKSGSKVRVTAICEICGLEKSITYSKYLVNKYRNDKGYYSCFGCKNIEKEKTCLSKYGVKSFSMTDEFKISESFKWKGTRKGDEKGRKTMIERYGVDSFSKTDKMKEMNREWMSSDEFKEKSKKTLISKFGKDSYSKTDEFKKTLSDKKEIIVDKIKQTFIEKYGVDCISKTESWKINFLDCLPEIKEKIKATCIERYGFDNVSKVDYVKKKIRDTKLESGLIIGDDFLPKWNLYKREVRKLTNRNKRKLYENWDGLDYYDNENIMGNLSLSHVNRFYPTIDHKISVKYGFVNNISSLEISDISNLCITKRYINSIKGSLIEEIFIMNLPNN